MLVVGMETVRVRLSIINYPDLLSITYTRRLAAKSIGGRKESGSESEISPTAFGKHAN